MALFKHPGTFNAGVAAAPATDAAFFGSDDVAVVRRPSAARGEPDENYERCAPLLSARCTHEQRCQTTSASSVCVCRNRNSPMTFSAGLSDPLLLIHGMQDDVVPFKTTMVLMERLMEQGNHCFGACPALGWLSAIEEPVGRMPGYSLRCVGAWRRAGDCRGGHAQLGSAAPRR